MSPASLRKPIILSAAMLFTRRIMQGMTSVQGSLGMLKKSQWLLQKHFVQRLENRMWQDPSYVKAFKLRGRSKQWANRTVAANMRTLGAQLNPAAHCKATTKLLNVATARENMHLSQHIDSS